MRQIEYIFVKTRGGNCLLLPTCSYGPVYITLHYITLHYITLSALLASVFNL